MTRLHITLFAFLTLGVANATTISVLPAITNVTTGSDFNVNIQIDSAADLYAWQFDFGYDPLVAVVSLVTDGTFLATGGPESYFAGTVDNASGSVSSVSSLLTNAVSGVSGSGLLATITLHAVGAGQSTLSAFNFILLDSTFSDISADTVPATVTVSAATATPEPGTAVLLLAGSFVFLWRRLTQS